MRGGFCHLEKMKFGKEFEAQLVQEWREAYMDYNYLKTILKDILHFKQKHTASPMTATTKEGRSLKRKVSFYRAFSGLTNKYRSYSPRKNHHEEDEAILVSSTVDEGDQYQTMFLMSSDEGGQFEVVFFRRLDDEFNKVVSFYKKKVEEAVAEADELSKQMNALIALRIKIDDPMLAGANISPSSSVSIHPNNGSKQQGKGALFFLSFFLSFIFFSSLTMANWCEFDCVLLCSLFGHEI